MAKRSKRFPKRPEPTTLHEENTYALEDEAEATRRRLMTIHTDLDAARGIPANDVVTMSREVLYDLCDRQAQIAAEDGFRRGATATIKIVYAGFLVTMQELGFDSDWMTDALNRIDRWITLQYEDETAVDAAYSQTGVRFIVKGDEDTVMEPRISETGQ